MNKKLSQSHISFNLTNCDKSAYILQKKMQKVLMALHSANISGKLWHPLNQHFDFELVFINHFFISYFFKH